MIHHLAPDLVHRNDVIVGHVVLVTLVIKGNVGLAIVRRVDIDPAVKDMSRRVGNVDGR